MMHENGMMGMGDAMGWGGMFLGPVAMIAFVALVIALVVALVRHA